VPDDTKTCLLLSSVGVQVFTKIKSQLKAENPTDKSYYEVVARHMLCTNTNWLW